MLSIGTGVVLGAAPSLWVCNVPTGQRYPSHPAIPSDLICALHFLRTERLSKLYKSQNPVQIQHNLYQITFSADRQQIVYDRRRWNGASISATKNGVDNVWLQALDDTAAHLTTDFKEEQIWSFHISQDDRNFARPLWS